MLKQDDVDWETFSLKDFKAFLLDDLENPRDRGQLATYHMSELCFQPGQTVQAFALEFKDAQAALDPDPEVYWNQYLLYKFLRELSNEILQDPTTSYSFDQIIQVRARIQQIQESE